MPAGLGFAPLNQQQVSTVTNLQPPANPMTAGGPTMPQPSPLSPQPQSPFPQFKDNPLGAVGLVLQNFAAGMQGRELPTERLVQQQLERRGMQMQLYGAGVTLAEKIASMTEGLPPDQRAKFLKAQIDGISRQVSPEMGQAVGDLLSLTGAASDAELAKARKSFDYLKKNGLVTSAIMELAGGDVKKALEIAQKIGIEQFTRGPQTGMGKIMADVRAGFLTGEQGDRMQKIEALSKLAGLIGKAKDEFNRNLDRFLQLEADGQTDTTEYKMLSKRLQRQTEGAAGFSLQFGEGGNLESLQYGPKNTALTASQAMAQQEQLDYLDNTISLIDRSIETIKQNPKTAGIMGSVRNLAQNALGIVEDVAPKEWADRAKEAIDSIPGISDEDSAKLADKYFNPKIGELQLAQNSIAVALAKLRIESGSGDVKAIGSIMDRALEDVGIFGVTSSQSVISRLESTRKLFANERAKLKSRFSGRTQESAPAAGSGGVDPELLQYMDPEDRKLFD